MADEFVFDCAEVCNEGLFEERVVNFETDVLYSDHNWRNQVDVETDVSYSDLSE